MAAQKAHLQAAKALSTILSDHAIGHAFIGGFAVNLLGHGRGTADVDVEIDVANISELRGRIAQLLIEADARFSLHGVKLIFPPADCPEQGIPVETLPIGELGLPRHLSVFRPGDANIPILRPGILVLTKIKRCVHLIGSTRPKSIVKLGQDVSDIEYLLKCLAEHNEKIDFVGYSTPAVDRLYSAVKNLVGHWKGAGEDDLVQLMDSVLEEDDRNKVMSE